MGDKMKDFRGFIDELENLIAEKKSTSSVEILLLQQIEFFNHVKIVSYPIFAVIILNETQVIAKIANALGDQAADFFKRNLPTGFGPIANALHIACLNGNLDTLKAILKILDKEKTEVFNLADGNGDLPLFLARRDSNKFLYLLEQGAGITLFTPKDGGQTIFQVISEMHYQLLSENKWNSTETTSYMYSISYLLKIGVTIPAQLSQSKFENLVTIDIATDIKNILIKRESLPAILLTREYLLKALQLSRKKYAVIKECSNEFLESTRWILLTFIGECLLSSLPSITEEQTNLLQNTSVPSDEKLKALIKGFIYQFSKSIDYTQATSFFEKSKDTFSEAFLLLAYQFISGQGQPKNYIKARENYFHAFEVAHRKCNERITPFSNLFYQVLRSIAQRCLENLIKNNSFPDQVEKMRTLVVLIECYLLKNEYAEAQKLIERTDCDLLTNEKIKFKELSGKVYYKYAKQCTDFQKTELLEKARLMQNSQACVELANQSIHNPLGSDYISALGLLIESLNAIGKVRVHEILTLLENVIDKLTLAQNDKENLAERIFNLLRTIFRKILANADNWLDYKNFLQNLMKKELFDNSIFAKYKIFAEYILYTAYDNGRQVDKKDLNADTIFTKLPLVGRLSSTEKKRKISEQLDKLKKNDEKFFAELEDLKKILEEDIGQVCIREICKTPIPETNFNNTISTAENTQPTPSAPPMDDSASQSKNKTEIKKEMNPQNLSNSESDYFNFTNNNNQSSPSRLYPLIEPSHSFINPIQAPEKLAEHVPMPSTTSIVEATDPVQNDVTKEYSGVAENNEPTSDLDKQDHEIQKQIAELQKKQLEIRIKKTLEENAALKKQNSELEKQNKELGEKNKQLIEELKSWKEKNKELENNNKKVKEIRSLRAELFNLKHPIFESKKITDNTQQHKTDESITRPRSNSSGPILKVV